MGLEEPEAGRWYLQRAQGGDAILMALLPQDRSKVTCPKCLAPMLFMGDQVVCYACGMTFHLDGRRVYRILEKDEVERALSSPAVTLAGDGMPVDMTKKTAGSPATEHKGRSHGA